MLETFSVLVALATLSSSWALDCHLTLSSSHVLVTEGDLLNVTVRLDKCGDRVVRDVSDSLYLTLKSSDPDVAELVNKSTSFLLPRPFTSDMYYTFEMEALFLGYTTIIPVVMDKEENVVQVDAHNHLQLTVERRKTWQSKAFAYSVAILISLAYVNMGCALDLDVVKETLRRPIGPAIGFICQFMIMPSIAFALGFVFDNPALHLGLFVTGCSPGGGASNIWTVTLGGNLDLSITMTFISTFSSFLMMPLLIFTMGHLVFDRTSIVIPYSKIATFAVCLVIPLALGLLIRRFLPRVSSFLVRILKPFALFLILFILVFGVWSNLYMFKLMTLDVVLAGMGLPWLGFAFGCTFARLTKREVPDIIAIAIETGVQNTGIAIFILWFTLAQPAGDMAAVVPVAVATMTPLPLTVALAVCKARSWMTKGAEASSACPLAHITKRERTMSVKSVSNEKLVDDDNNSVTGMESKGDGIKA